VTATTLERIRPWPLLVRLLAVYDARLVRSRFFQLANSVSWAVVLVCGARVASGNTHGLWPRAVSWLIWTTAWIAVTPLQASNNTTGATRELAQLRGLPVDLLPIAPWLALWLRLLRVFSMRGVMISLLVLWPSSWQRASTLLQSLGLLLVSGAVLTLSLAALRAGGHYLQPRHPRRLLLAALLLPPLVQPIVPSVSGLTAACARLATSGARTFSQ